jgi:RHS repeat-associated protein
MEPELALVYNSHGATGLLGVGWSLTGLSRITRCRRVVAKDGEAREIQFADGPTGDRYCLDNQRLVVVGGPNGVQSPYGGDGTEYRTEIDMQAKIVSHTPDALGPTSFSVYLKNGRILTYGDSSSTRLEGERLAVRTTVTRPSTYGPLIKEWAEDRTTVRYLWALAETRDRAGNYFKVEYARDDINPGYDLRPTTLKYTGFAPPPGTTLSPLAPLREVRLLYEKRTDSIETYVSGLRLLQAWRLSRIEALGPSATGSPRPLTGSLRLLRSYNLDYRESVATNRSLLTAVTECDGEKNCKPPTTFAWTAGDGSFSDYDAGPVPDGCCRTEPNDHSSLAAWASGWWIADVNGDGRDDLLSGNETPLIGNAGPPYSGPNGGPLIDPPPGTVFMPSPRAYSERGRPIPPPRYIDVNGDGIPDRIAIEPPPPAPGGLSNSLGLRVNTIYLSTPTGFRLADEPVPPERLVRPGYVVDFDGDGAPDILQQVYVNGVYVWRYRLNPGGRPGPWIPTSFPIVFSDLTPIDPYYGMALDPTGSGRFGLMINSGSIVRLGPGGLEATAMTLADEFCEPLFMDLNGDGLLDWVARGKGADIGLAINTGNGFRAPVKWTIPEKYAPAYPSYRIGPPLDLCDSDFNGGSGVRVADLNGDGRQDLVLMAGIRLQGTAGNPLGTRLVVLFSTGSGFTPREIGIAASDQSGPGVWKQAQVLDINGDGLTDLVQRQASRLHVFMRTGKPPDLLERVMDGAGAYETFDYQPVSAQQSNTEAASDCHFPLTCVRRGMWVVGNHGIDSGNATPRTWSHRYGEGRTDVQLREWLGFGWTQTIDNVSGQTTTVTYDNRTRVGATYPYARLPRTTTVETTTKIDQERVTSRTPSTVRTSSTVTTYRLVNSSPNSLFVFPSVVESRELERELPSSPVLLSHSIRRESRDEFGNPTLVEVECYPIVGGQPAGIPDRERSMTAYDNFTASWLIGLARSISVTSATPDNRTATRLIEHDYHATTGLLLATRIEPQSARGVAPEALSLYSETVFDRDAFGSIVGVRNSASGQTRIETAVLDPLEHSMMVERRNAAGHTWQYGHDSGLGLPTYQRDPNGVEESIMYDGFGRTRSIQRQGSFASEIAYETGPNGRLRTRIKTLKAGVIEVLYDRLGREVSRSWESENGVPALVETNYNQHGRIAQMSLPRFVGQPPRFEVFTYDNLDRLITHQHPDSSTIRFEYRGLLTERKDEKGNRQFVKRDERGRIVESVRVGPSNHEVRTRLRYGPFDAPRQIADPGGNVIEFETDRLGRTVRHVDPHTGVTTAVFNGFGEIVSTTDGAGRTTSATRDLLGRPQSLTTSDGVVTLTWDTSPGGIGGLASTTSADQVSTSYRYDKLGRLSGRTFDINGEQFDFGYTYNAKGQLSTLSYPQIPNRPRFMLSWDYTPSGFLKKVTDTTGAVVWTVKERDPAGRILNERFASQVMTTYTFDDNRGLLRTAQTTSPVGNSRVQDLEFEWEPNGNLFRRYEHKGKWAEEFHYDSLDRLEVWDSYNLAANTRVSTAYTFDDLGNLRTRTVPDAPAGQDVVTYRYGENGAGPTAPTSSLGDAAVWTYDAVGNQITAPARMITYNSLNLPHSISAAGKTISFRYDASGARVMKSVDSTDSTVSLGNLYERRTRGGVTTHTFLVPGDRRIVAQYRTTSTSAGYDVTFIHADHLGSIESLTDPQGNALEQRAYDPFGRRQDPSNRGRPLAGAQANSVALGFTSHQHDDDLGLVNMRGRIYDPMSVHFLSADPVVANPADGRLWNRYGYALNNPLTLTDPSGLVAGGGKGHGGYETTVTGHHSSSDTPTPTGGGSDSNPSSPPTESSDDKGTKYKPAPPEILSKWRADPNLYEDSESNIGGFGLDVRTPDAILYEDSESSVGFGLDLRTPEKAPNRPKPLNFEGYIWFSTEVKGEGEVQLGKTGVGIKGGGGAELIFIHGWNRTGPFDATVFAYGPAVGVNKNGGKEAFVELYGGKETITQGEYGTETTHKETESIILVGGGYGHAVSGAYQTGSSGEHTGVYAGGHFESWAAGIGFDLDLLWLWFGAFGPAQTDNPWYQGPNGLPIVGPAP